MPDSFAAPNLLPPDFINVSSPRGTVFSSRTDRFQVSANAGVAPIEFDNLAQGHSEQFATFSPQRLFSGLDSVTTQVDFFVPGSTTPATTDGFGAVFTDWTGPGRRSSTTASTLSCSPCSRAPVSPGAQTLSFLGVGFSDSVVASVRIRSGDVPPQLAERRNRDVVVMDDFIYGEPVG